jgi:hypothetical protein
MNAPPIFAKKPPSMKLNMTPTKPTNLPGAKVLFYAPPGFGKTTLALHAKNPFLIYEASETGYEHLLVRAGSNPIPNHKSISWTETLAVVEALASEKVKYVFLDSLGCFQSQCARATCAEDFKGNQDDYDSYGRGNERMSQRWQELLVALDKLSQSGKHVIILAHADIKTHQNPTGKDWDAFVPQAHRKVVDRTVSWCSEVLFGNYLASLDKDGKATSQDRMVYAGTSAAMVAKSQRGCEPLIKVPNNPTQSFDRIFSFLEGV